MADEHTVTEVECHRCNATEEVDISDEVYDAFQRGVQATKAACLAVAHLDPVDHNPIDGIRRRINAVVVEDK